MINLYIGLITLALFIFAMIIGRINYRSYNKDKYSLLNRFPYELQDKPYMRYTNYYRFVLALFCGSLIIYGIFAFIVDTQLMLNDFLGIVFILNCFFIYMLLTIDMNYYKVHLLVDALVMVFTFISYVLVGYIGFRDPEPFYYEPLKYISLSLTLIMLLQVLFPGLKNWTRLKKEMNSDGSVQMKRGKFFILSFYEWCFVFYNVLLVILTLATKKY